MADNAMVTPPPSPGGGVGGEGVTQRRVPNKGVVG